MKRSASRPLSGSVPAMVRFIVAVLVVAIWSPLSAQEPVPWRGSLMLYRNTASAISLDKSAEPTYNPYFAMTLQLSPRWWFGKYVGLFADADVTRELTDADDTTRAGEWWFGDVRAGVAGRAPTVPVLGLDVAGKLSLIAPTSKISHARTMILGIRPELSLSRTFPLLSGLTVAYAVQGTRYLHEYTTSQREVPLIPGCASGLGGCDRFVNLGLRNPEWRLANAVALSMDFFPWLGLSADFAVVVDWLYAQKEVADRVSFEPQEGTDQRFVMAYSVEVYGKPMPSLGLALGMSTVNPQLKPDSTLQDPFVNRYTTLYFDVRFHIDGFIAQLRNPGGK
jgi:hypothetical protein